MPGYTDVFGSYGVPPAEAAYSALALSANLTLQWPEFFTGTGSYITGILDVTPSVGSLTLSLPDATKVSVGREVLIRNLGSFSFSLLDNAGGAIATISAGTAHYMYLSANATAAGTWGHVAFGVGTSSVDAASLIGYGVKAIAATLNQSHPTFSASGNLTIDSTYRAKLVVGTDTGATSVTLGAASTLGDDFFFMYHNSGAGTTTFTPNGTDKIDGQSTFTVQPGESLMLVCSGSGWMTVGYGRSVVYNFTQLTYDVSLGGTFTLTAAEASNKLITFTGNPTAGVTVIVPQTVAVYYLYNNISTAFAVNFKTIAGAGVSINQSSRTIAVCDGTYVVSAQSITASTNISLVNGAVTNPALNFATSSNTGLYLNGASGMGIAIGGVAALLFDNSGNITTSKTVGINPGSIITSAPSVAIAQTWNAVGTTFDASTITITDTASAAASRFVNYLVGTTSKFSVDKIGNLIAAGTLSSGAAGGVTGSALFKGATSGTITVIGTAIAGSNTITLPALTGTVALVGTGITNVGDFGLSGALSSGSVGGTLGSLALKGTTSGAVTGTTDATGSKLTLDKPLSVAGTFDATGTISTTNASNTAGLTATASTASKMAFLQLISQGASGYIAREGSTPALGGASGDLVLYNSGVLALQVSTVGLVTLTQGQIKFPATQNASADANTLDDYVESSYTATLTGCTTSPTYTVKYTKVGNIVVLKVPDTTATSNSTTKTLTGMPAAITPPNQEQYLVLRITDNTATKVAGRMWLNSAGEISFGANFTSNAFTAAGTFASDGFRFPYTVG